MKKIFLLIITLSTSLLLVAAENNQPHLAIRVTAPNLVTGEKLTAHIPLLPGVRTITLPDATLENFNLVSVCCAEGIYNFNKQGFNSQAPSMSFDLDPEFLRYRDNYVDVISYETYLELLSTLYPDQSLTQNNKQPLLNLSDSNIILKPGVKFLFKAYIKDQGCNGSFAVNLNHSREFNFFPKMTKEKFERLTHAINNMFNSHINESYSPVDISTYTTITKLLAEAEIENMLPFLIAAMNLKKNHNT